MTPSDESGTGLHESLLGVGLAGAARHRQLPDDDAAQVYLDALRPHIAILDRAGTLVMVNLAWERFMADRAPGIAASGLGCSVVEVCNHVFDAGAAWARAAVQGIRDVLAGRRAEYSVRYPAPAPSELRWYALDVRSLRRGGGAIVTHEDITPRVRSEEALRESERRFARATTAAKVWVWEWNLETKEWYLDPAMKLFAGYSAAEVSDSIEGWRSLLPPDDLAAMDAAVAAAVKGETVSFDMKHRVLRRNGSTLWLHARGKVIRDEDGKAIQMLGTLVDITTAMEIEDALRRSEGKNRALIEAIPDMIVRFTPDGTILAGKRPREFDVGDDPDGLVGLGLDQLFPVNVVDQLLKAVRGGPGGGNATTIEYQLREDRGDRYYEGRVVSSSPFDAVCLVRDITDRRLAEQQLLTSHGRLKRQVQDRTQEVVAARRELEAESVERRRTAQLLHQREEEYRLTLAQAPLGLTTVAADGTFVQINQAICDILGYDREELLLKTFDELTHTDDLELSRSFWHDTTRGDPNERRSMRVRYVRKDGEVVDAVLHTVRVPGTDGVPERIIAQVEDRTEQVHAQEELRQQRERLAHVSRVSTLGEMAASIAHEVNQPLTAIANYARACSRLVENGSLTEPEAVEIMNLISDESLRAGEIIRGLRDLVRKRESRRVRCNLNTLMHDVMTLAEADARLQNVTIELRLTNGLPDVVVDGVQVEQVILNLIRNAVEAMHGAGPNAPPVVVKTAVASSGARAVEISVCDAGPGIPPGDGDEVFRPFYTTKDSGMGMGLSISRTIVTSHGGQLWHTPNAGAGTTFRFTIPTADAPDDS